MASPALGRLVTALADARRDGQDFDAVWRRAVRDAGPAADLREAIYSTADCWRRAYEREPATVPERATLSLHELWADDAGMEAINGRPVD